MGPEGWGPKISSFFFTLLLEFQFNSLYSLGVFPWNFGGVFRCFFLKYRQIVSRDEAFAGVQGVHVVNIADDSDEKLSDTESEPSRNAVERPKAAVDLGKTAKTRNGIGRMPRADFGHEDRPLVARCADPRS